MCPAEERDLLRRKWMQMGMSRDVTAGMPVGAPSAPRLPTLSTPAPVVLDEEAHTAKRLSLILDPLMHQQPGAAPMAQADPQAVAQILTMAAASSKRGQQLNDYFEQNRSLPRSRRGHVLLILR